MSVRSVFRVLWINAAVLLAGALLCELIFGGWLRRDALYRLDPLRNTVLHYDVHGLYPTATPRITYSRDRYGLRGDYGGDPAAIQVLAVGGSTTDQRYITDGETWIDELQRTCAASGRRAVIANAGLDGQSTVGHLDALDWWFPNVPRLKPRFVVYYIGLNDFYIDGGDVEAPTGMRRIVKRAKDQSALWHLGRTLWGVYLAQFVFGLGHHRVDFGSVAWTRDPLQRDYAFADGRVAAFGRRVEALIDRTRQFGAEPVFVTQPSRYYRATASGVEGRAEALTYAGHPIDGVDAYQIMRRLDARMEQVSRARHAAFADLAGHSTWDDGDFYDFQHMTPAGAAKLGRGFFGEIGGTICAPAGPVTR